jgi:lipopolysaccharide/colanic/teichoic acid biosynthesis glycosyltransferase
MKRAADTVLSCVGLVLFFPLLMVVGALVALTSPGPALYWQTRVGLRGQRFMLCKFRTMVPGADRLGSSVTSAGDDRITRLGALLRRTKLDELPQLWNVLRGDMSFVGPRPEVPEIVADYTPEMRRVFDVRPGITSIASLKLRDEQSLLAAATDPDLAYQRIVVPAKVELAMLHVRRDSAFLDICVLMQTIWILSLGRLQPPRDDEFVSKLRCDIAILNRTIADQAEVANQ